MRSVHSILIIFFACMGHACTYATVDTTWQRIGIDLCAQFTAGVATQAGALAATRRMGLEKSTAHIVHGAGTVTLTLAGSDIVNYCLEKSLHETSDRSMLHQYAFGLGQIIGYITFVQYCKNHTRAA